MTARRYYICDSRRKVRLSGTHRTLDAALKRCSRLNADYDDQNGRPMARYFCGDWVSPHDADNLTTRPGDWPWERNI